MLRSRFFILLFLSSVISGCTENDSTQKMLSYEEALAFFPYEQVSFFPKDSGDDSYIFSDGSEFGEVVLIVEIDSTEINHLKNIKQSAGTLDELRRYKEKYGGDFFPSIWRNEAFNSIISDSNSHDLRILYADFSKGKIMVNHGNVSGYIFTNDSRLILWTDLW